MNKYEVIRDALTAGANEIERLRKENEKLKQYNQLLRAVAVQTGYMHNKYRGMTKGMKDALQAAINSGALNNND